MIWILLCIFGLIIGSFLNVVVLRYQEGEPLLGYRIIGGRSKCMACQVGLKWYELVPLLSFLVQGAKCRHCKHSLNWQYPIVEFVTALLTMSVPYLLYTTHGGAAAFAAGTGAWFFVLCALWMIASYTLVVLSAIDLRLRIIPDQCNLLLAIIGAILVALKIAGVIPNIHFSGAYAEVFGAAHSTWLSAAIGVAFALALFGGTVFFTRGRGMGMGDLKLALPIGLILGWPDVLISTISAFVIGSIIGLLMIAGKRATMKAAVPFGPFIVIGFYVALFYGESLLRWYFSLV